jgi:hypothetical protein
VAMAEIKAVMPEADPHAGGHSDSGQGAGYHGELTEREELLGGAARSASRSERRPSHG